MSTITHFSTLSSLECCSCGMAFALSDTWLKKARELGGFQKQFWCPYCNTQQGWGVGLHEKEINRLKGERDRAKEEAEYQKKRKMEAEQEAEHFRKSRDGMKGALRKVKVRIGRGVCPCCNRSFENLRRHMESKHPEVKAGGVE